MGGHDPYSASKGCAEIAIASYRRSFFAGTLRPGHTGAPVALASARAGNVIGGGDWAEDRIVPDCIRAHCSAAQRDRGPPQGRARAPGSMSWSRSSGYLLLGQQMADAISQPTTLPRWSGSGGRRTISGPGRHSNRSVAELVRGNVCIHWPGSWEEQAEPRRGRTKRACCKLSIDKAFAPAWAGRPCGTLRRRSPCGTTVGWYRDARMYQARRATSIGFADLTRAADCRVRSIPSSQPGTAVSRFGRRINQTMSRSPAELKQEILKLDPRVRRRAPTGRSCNVRVTRTASIAALSFVPGETTVPYAGRVFDGRRGREAAVGSTLDFLADAGQGRRGVRGRSWRISWACKTVAGWSIRGRQRTCWRSAALTSARSCPTSGASATGDEVITCAAGFPTTVAPIIQHGAVPVFIDNDPRTGNADLARNSPKRPSARGKPRP